MSETIRLSHRPALLADIHVASGHLVRLHDRELNLVTIPSFRGPLPLAVGGLAGIKAATHVLTGGRVPVREDVALGPVLDLTGNAAYILA